MLTHKINIVQHSNANNVDDIDETSFIGHTSMLYNQLKVIYFSNIFQNLVLFITLIHAIINIPVQFINR